MPVLDFDHHNGKVQIWREWRKKITALFCIAGILALGSSLAANINLNEGKAVEFGQGVALTSSCDESILVTPFSGFVNSNSTSFTLSIEDAGPTAFRVTDISRLQVGMKFSSPALGQNNVITVINHPIEGIYTIEFTGGQYSGPTSETATFIGGGFFLNKISISQLDITDQTTESPKGCKDKDLTIKFYGVGNSALASISFTNDGDTFSSSNGEISNVNTSDRTNSRLDLTLLNLTVKANDVLRITIESGSIQFDYFSSLTSGKPTWLMENLVNRVELLSKFDSNGMGFQGDADERKYYPYKTNFSINSAQKVELSFDFFHEFVCSDQGIAFFRSGSNAEWQWAGENSSAMVVQFNCPSIEINGPFQTSRSNSLLQANTWYVATITYDPSLSTNKLTVIIRNKQGIQIFSGQLDDDIPSSGNYVIGFGADFDGTPELCDMEEDCNLGSNYSYFKNLGIKIG